MSEHLLEVKGLKQHFPIKTGFLKTKMLKAVDGVSFTIDAGETMGLVGESGCGKTTVGRSILRLIEPTAGQVVVDIVYRPRFTPWLRAAQAVGAATVDGLGMLIHQAALQEQIWLGRLPDLAAMTAAAHASLPPDP